MNSARPNMPETPSLQPPPKESRPPRNPGMARLSDGSAEFIPPDHTKNPKLPNELPAPEESGPPHNPGLRRLIEGKRKAHYTPDKQALALGFRGWHERGYLPHFDAPYVTQLVTFNLADSFPVTRRAEWELLLNEPDTSVRRRQLEAWLDRGYGECWLRQPPVAALVERVLLAGHGQIYALQAWVIMPNHVHVVVDVWQTPLSQMVKTWKGSTSHEANACLGRTGNSGRWIIGIPASLVINIWHRRSAM